MFSVMMKEITFTIVEQLFEDNGYSIYRQIVVADRLNVLAIFSFFCGVEQFFLFFLALSNFFLASNNLRIGSLIFALQLRPGRCFQVQICANNRAMKEIRYICFIKITINHRVLSIDHDSYVGQQPVFAHKQKHMRISAENKFKWAKMK